MHTIPNKTINKKGRSPKLLVFRTAKLKAARARANKKYELNLPNIFEINPIPTSNNTKMPT
jgi:hypothetical protein